MSLAPPVLPLAAGGPVIPHFGGASNCVVQNRQFCGSWFTQNFNTVFGPRLVQHIELTAIAVGVGMAIAFAAAIFAYRQTWFETPFSLFSAFLYGIPAIALFELLVQVTGINRLTAEIGLVSYTLLILFRNMLAGCAACPTRPSRPRARWVSHPARRWCASSYPSPCRRSWPGSGSPR